MSLMRGSTAAQPTSNMYKLVVASHSGLGGYVFSEASVQGGFAPRDLDLLLSMLLAL